MGTTRNPGMNILYSFNLKFQVDMFNPGIPGSANYNDISIMTKD